MATEFSPAPQEVIDIAERLLPDHPYLDELGLGFIMRDEAAISKGVKVLAKVYKPPTWADAFDLDYDYIVELPADIWNHLVSHQREAMVDYALSCIKPEIGNNGLTYKLVSPDVQGFRSNMERYGLWWPGAEAANSAFVKASQIELPGVARQGRLESVARDFINKQNADGYDVDADPDTRTITLTKRQSGEQDPVAA